MNRSRVLLAAIGTAVIVAAAAWFTAFSPLGPANDYVQSTCDQGQVCLTRTDDGLVATPVDQSASTGFVFYTGARVDPEAYGPIALRLADAGYPVWIPALTLNFAVLDQQAADAVIEANPDIERWILAGHSLGGAMAARYAAEHDVDGLALLAAYPEEALDLSDSNVEVVSVFGTADGLADVDEVLGAADQLPDSTMFVSIDGGNHAQFGDYGRQRGDNEATVDVEKQWDQTVEAMAGLAERIDSR